MFRVLLPFLIAIFSTVVAFAEGGGVHGDDAIAKLLNSAHDLEVPQIINLVDPSDSTFDDATLRVSDGAKTRVVGMHEFYGSIIKTLKSTLKTYQLRDASQDELTDSLLGYHTWIGVKVSTQEILYNSVSYKENNLARPTQEGMDEYIIHEMGHVYKLDEDSCQRFARLITYAYEQMQKTIGLAGALKACRLDGGECSSLWGCKPWRMIGPDGEYMGNCSASNGYEQCYRAMMTERTLCRK